MFVFPGLCASKVVSLSVCRILTKMFEQFIKYNVNQDIPDILFVNGFL